MAGSSSCTWWEPFRGSQKEFVSGRRKSNVGRGSWTFKLEPPPSPPPEEDRRPDVDAVGQLLGPAAATDMLLTGFGDPKDEKH